MNKIITLIVLLAAPVASLMAEEYAGNPDRFPSVGLNWAGSAEKGDATVFGTGISAKQDVEVTNGAFVLDLRLPVSNNVTLSGSVASLASSFDAPETPLLLGQKSETTGFAFSVGVRFYIH